MVEACNRIMQDFLVMVKQWVAVKAEETGLERRRVREFIGGIID